jgi:hypothetical protein
MTVGGWEKTQTRVVDQPAELHCVGHQRASASVIGGKAGLAPNLVNEAERSGVILSPQPVIQ